MSYVTSIAVDVFIRSVTKLWKQNIDGRMYYVKISITQGKSFVNKVFIAIILRIFVLLTKSKSSRRKKCKKKL